MPRDHSGRVKAVYVHAALGLLVACSGDEGGAAGSNIATAGQPPMTAGTSSAGSSAAGNSVLPVGTAGSSGMGSAGAPAGRGGSASGTGGAHAAAGVTGASTVGASAAGAPAAGAAGGAPDPNVDTCDRACLLEFIKGYTDALVAHDPSKLKVSASLKYTENGVVSKLGDTVWQTAMSVVMGTVLSFADPVEGQVATQLVINETGSVQGIYQVRLKVVKREITEIEGMVVRQGGQFYNPDGMKPEPVFMQMIDPAKRQTREQLKAVTELYLGYLEGDKSASEVGFDEMCKRYENGTSTADGLSSFNLQSWNFDVTHRILVIDEEAGITWGMFPFQQTESALVVGEAFKIIDSKIMMIQAVMTNMPAKAWD